MRFFPFYKQMDAMDCGPTCLRMILKFYGKHYSLQTLRAKSGMNREGTSILGISEAAEYLGFRTRVVKISVKKLSEEAIVPLIAHCNQGHFVVVYKIKRNKFYVADPGSGKTTYSREEFSRIWIPLNDDKGVVMLLEPGQEFYAVEDESRGKLNFELLFKYLSKHKKLIVQLLLGLLLSSFLQLIFPLLTQAVVDVGINTKDVGFIYMIMIAQFMLFLGQTSIEFIRSWVLLHINTRLSISILTDFLIKLMKLPISFFEGKMVGDITQRIADQQRIQTFLTGPSLNLLFSIFNFIVFTIVIIHYNISIFLVFIGGSICYAIWVLRFLKYRKKLDYKRFDILSNSQSNIIQIVQGMQEIKMNNLESLKRWQWEQLQAKIFKVSIKSLELTQYQQGGASFINQGKNILITFLSAMAVVHGQMTLGAMLALQYIIGQLNAPVEQLIMFVQLVQDAKISMERLNEIHSLEDEELNDSPEIWDIPATGDIILSDVSYAYPGAGNASVLNNINLTIPRGKTTAIVGMSGSGKTTLIKTLMKFYSPNNGEIKVGCVRLQDIRNKAWRGSCGAVMQDNYIFPDTIVNNIALNDERPDAERLRRALQIANISDFIASLPLGLNTMIGASGSGVSQGQRQRILIARAVYKNPDFIFFDEATNSLDATNERIIMQELAGFFTGKTVVIAAHRLSTIKDADQIVVMKNGIIIENGTHNELLALRGDYFMLIKNQLNNNDLR